jgi:hypothetical protein
MTKAPNPNVVMLMTKIFADRHAWNHDFYKSDLAPLGLTLGPHPLYLDSVAPEDGRLSFVFNLDDAFGEEQDAPPLVRTVAKGIVDELCKSCPEMVAWLAAHPGLERTIEFWPMPPKPPARPPDL